MFIRQQAFTGKKVKLLKGGLHCHTTRSDGKAQPDECIRLHAANGYDFLALTDHRYYNYANYAPETDVLIVPGMEMDGNLTGDDKGMCFHIVAVGPEADKNGYKQDERLNSVRVKDQYEFQPVVDSIRAHNNLAIYCHPDWSRTPARSFEDIKGCFAMEIWNSGCVIETDTDVDNGFIWDELLMNGKRIYCVATDDGHAVYQHCKGWVRVKAEKNVESILRALENGEYYSSTGPEIYDFYVEDGVAHVECSNARMIHFITALRPTGVLKPAEGEYLTHGEAKLNDKFKYVRVVVEDENGRRAWSNPIWLK